MCRWKTHKTYMKTDGYEIIHTFTGLKHFVYLNQRISTKLAELAQIRLDLNQVCQVKIKVRKLFERKIRINFLPI